MESDSSGLILLDNQEVELFIVQSQKSEVTFFRSPRAKPTTFYEGLGTMAPTVGDRPPLSLNWASLALTAPLREVSSLEPHPLCPFALEMQGPLAEPSGVFLP